MLLKRYKQNIKERNAGENTAGKLLEAINPLSHTIAQMHSPENPASLQILQNYVGISFWNYILRYQLV